MKNWRIAPTPAPAHGPLMRFEGGAASTYENMTMPNLSEPLVGGVREDSKMSEDKHGYSCPHGCGGDMKSPHGLARHIKARHGGFGGLGKTLKTHGVGAKAAEPRAGFMGARTASPHESRISSYSGDGGGSYGRNKQG